MINTGGIEQATIEQLQQCIAELENEVQMEQEAKEIAIGAWENTQARIAELKKKNAQYAKMCVRNDEWLCARDQEIQRLDAALDDALELAEDAALTIGASAQCGGDLDEANTIRNKIKEIGKARAGDD
jgi:hypothetical protein